ncbi:hypothetical protein [Algoriphagus confluentis]|uniref:DUF4221 domain-containing protein n=1 Tax=Algoriphagus confluentis TaxID=1697556 RepID=A0ABQ6PRC8_9BACT|nr:hypothetical protein Aconfl_23810 [Algoriphagus confluentis]
MKNQCLCLFSSAVFLFSCGPSATERPPTFSLVLEDSLVIDQLEPRYLIDYDASKGKYLLSNESYYHYLEVDESGEILRKDSIPWDGPNAVSMILGMGYADGKVALATDSKGFLFYENGNPVDQLSIPYAYTSFNFLPKLTLIPWKGGYLYPRFMAESELEGGFNEEFYSKTYSDPLFAFQKEGDSLQFMVSLPEEAQFLDGQFHGSLVLVPYLNGNDFYLLDWIRPEILHYKDEGGEFVYQRTIILPLESWVGYDPVPMNQASSFYESYGKKMPGTVRDIFPIGAYFLVQYQNGIAEDVFPKAKNESGRLDPEKIYQLNPPLLAVLDQNLTVLATGIELPGGVNGQLVVDKQGQLIAVKNPSLSSTEEEGLVLYRMKLKVD